MLNRPDGRRQTEAGASFGRSRHVIIHPGLGRTGPSSTKVPSTHPPPSAPSCTQAPDERERKTHPPSPNPGVRPDSYHLCDTGCLRRCLQAEAKGFPSRTRCATARHGQHLPNFPAWKFSCPARRAQSMSPSPATAMTCSLCQRHYTRQQPSHPPIGPSSATWLSERPYVYRCRTGTGEISAPPFWHSRDTASAQLQPLRDA